MAHDIDSENYRSYLDTVHEDGDIKEDGMTALENDNYQSKQNHNQPIITWHAATAASSHITVNFKIF